MVDTGHRLCGRRPGRGTRLRRKNGARDAAKDKGTCLVVPRPLTVTFSGPLRLTQLGLRVAVAPPARVKVDVPPTLAWARNWKPTVVGKPRRWRLTVALLRVTDVFPLPEPRSTSTVRVPGPFLWLARARRPCDRAGHRPSTQVAAKPPRANCAQAPAPAARDPRPRLCLLTSVCLLSLCAHPGALVPKR